jgi:Protein of unknown function (DUF2938)
MTLLRAVAGILIVGVIATLAMDLWQRLLQMTIRRPLGSWALIGRWVAGFPRGAFVHGSIATVPSVHGELAIGWAFHYAVGFAYAAAYLALLQFGLRSAPTLLSAVIFALALLVAPWFVMQPALGQGFMASHMPNPVAVRAVNVSVHLVFGLGLYLGALLWYWLRP